MHKHTQHQFIWNTFCYAIEINILLFYSFSCQNRNAHLLILFSVDILPILYLASFVARQSSHRNKFTRKYHWSFVWCTLCLYTFSPFENICVGMSFKGFAFCFWIYFSFKWIVAMHYNMTSETSNRNSKFVCFAKIIDWMLKLIILSFAHSYSHDFTSKSICIESNLHFFFFFEPITLSAQKIYCEFLFSFSLAFVHMHCFY